MAIKKINISGEIGWDVLPFMIKEQFEGETGDIEIDLSSPGGSLFDGIEIYNMIRDYKRENPKSQMILNIKGLAASMASYIASNPAFDLVTIEDNATFMLHNPLMGVIGDYQEMEKAYDHLKRLAAMMAVPYADKSGKSIKEIREMMDKETYFYGKEIIKAGFADEVIKTEKKKNKEAAIAECEIKFQSVRKKIREKEMDQEYFEQIAAITKDFNISVDKNNSNNNNDLSSLVASCDKNIIQEQKMDIGNIDDLKKELPEIYEKAIEAGKIQEQERVCSLLEMKNKKDFENLEVVKNRIDEGIMNGEDIMDVKLGIQALLSKDDVKAAMDTNDIGDLNTPGNQTVSGEKEKEIKDDNRREF